MVSCVTDDISSPFPGLSILNFEPGMDMQAFRLSLREVLLKLFPNHKLDLSSAYNTAHRSPNTPRDEWSPDHYWHSDQSYIAKRPFATALYGAEIDGEVAGTDFIDTRELLLYIAKDDPKLFAQLANLSGVFTWSSYFDRTLQKAGEDAIDRAREINGMQSISSIAQIRALRYPASTHPLIQIHPVTKEETLYFDERVIRIAGIPRIEDIEIQEKLRAYLELSNDELARRPYFHHMEWEPGQMTIFTNTGTLHRALAGNDGLRTLHRSLVIGT